MNLRQLLFRPTASLYRTAVNVLCLCGASTPPGGGVYDMSGFHSAQAGMRYLRHSSWVRSLRRGGWHDDCIVLGINSGNR
jgi:phytoene dehydrogenase-like protein